MGVDFYKGLAVGAAGVALAVMVSAEIKSASDAEAEAQLRAVEGYLLKESLSPLEVTEDGQIYRKKIPKEVVDVINEYYGVIHTGKSPDK